MKMLSRLQYLYSEGFEVASLSGYDDETGESNAKITYISRNKGKSPQLVSEFFKVEAEEMEQCSTLFLNNLGNNKS